MSKPADVQYLEDLAAGYANSFIDGWQDERRRLLYIAKIHEELLAAAEEFVQRVERGEIRSKYTYNKFREILVRSTPIEQTKG